MSGLSNNMELQTMNKTSTGTGISIVLLAILAYVFGIEDSNMQQQFVEAAMAPADYREARELFWSELYPAGGETLYCGQTFRQVDHDTMNIEHVFPMSWVSWKLKCGERRQCRAKSEQFNRIEADMHNLYPALIHINEARRSHPFGMVKGEQRRFGSCDIEIDRQKKLVEPRAAVRGDIARAMFYMADRYQLEIRERQYQTLSQWHQQDPVSDEERRRNQAIKSIQGNSNPYIE